ncbi:hypothetical protein K469DRAFT_563946, partial [Zopfia rhizophila CBS 207.26]
PHNHVFNHVAVSVPDCDAAVNRYGKVFGFKRIRSGPKCPNAPIFKTYDSKLHKVTVAWLGTGNSVGFGVFEFMNPPHQLKPNFEYNRAGFFHIAATAPDVDAACKRAVEAGEGKEGETVDMGGGEKSMYLSIRGGMWWY